MKKSALIYFAGLALALSPIVVSAEGVLSTSCVGAPSPSSITWTASSVGGIAPIAFLWGNNNTSSVQTVAVTPGTYSMTIKATDTSSTVATSTCSTTVNQPTGTGTNVQKQIQDLLNQIAALKVQLISLLQQQGGGNGGVGTTTPGALPPGLCRKVSKDLHRGYRGDDVKELQRFLSTDRSIFPEGNVTGFFGEQTERAVKKFQKKHGIFSVSDTTTGFFGPKTREKFIERCEKGKEDRDDERDEHRGGRDDGTTTPRMMLNIRSGEGDDRNHGRGGY